MMLEAITCPDCGRSTGPAEYLPDQRGGPPAAQSYASCLRKCISCEIGFSNTRDPNAVVRIHRDPLRNIPEQVRDGALEALGAALNVRNRENKREKFAFETSEDAVTWTVFRHMKMSGALGRVLSGCVPELEPSESPKHVPEFGTRVPAEPALLLCGAPALAGDSHGDRIPSWQRTHRRPARSCGPRPVAHPPLITAGVLQRSASLSIRPAEARFLPRKQTRIPIRNPIDPHL